MTADSVYITYKTLREALPEAERLRLDGMISADQKPPPVRRRARKRRLPVWTYQECMEYMLARHFNKSKKKPAALSASAEGAAM